MLDQHHQHLRPFLAHEPWPHASERHAHARHSHGGTEHRLASVQDQDQRKAAGACRRLQLIRPDQKKRREGASSARGGCCGCDFERRVRYQPKGGGHCTHFASDRGRRRCFHCSTMCDKTKAQCELDRAHTGVGVGEEGASSSFAGNQNQTGGGSGAPTTDAGDPGLMMTAEREPVGAG